MPSRLTRTLQSLVANGVLAVLFAAAPTPATAEAWVAMDNGKGYRYEFDADAVERVTNWGVSGEVAMGSRVRK